MAVEVRRNWPLASFSPFSTVIFSLRLMACPGITRKYGVGIRLIKIKTVIIIIKKYLLI